MRSAFADVRTFHLAMDQPIGSRPARLADDRRELRISLIREEALELLNAMAFDNLVEIADGMADLIYVVIGAAIEYGIDLPAVWAEVQRTNMAKAGGPVRADGKRLKPAGWTPPDIAGVLDRQGSIRP